MTDVTLTPADAEARLGFDAVRARLLHHARTPYGAEALGGLRPSSDAEIVRGRLGRAGEMMAVVGFDDPFPLGTTDDVRPVLARLRPAGSLADGPDLGALARVLATLRLVHDYLHARKAKAQGLWAVAEQIVVLKALEDRITRTVDEGGHVRDDASPHLADLTRTLAQASSRLRETLSAALRDAIAHGWATEAQPTIRGGRAVIPVRAEAKRKVQGFVHDVSASGQTVFIEPASVLDLNNEIREIEIERAREIERILREVSAHARHHGEDVAAGLTALGRLDAAASVARLSLETGALVPEVGEDGPLRLVAARHVGLVLREALKAETERRPVVPLDLSMGDGGGPDDARPEAATVLVVTGPNAGGKSVAMKTVGLTTLMACCGLPVPAAPGTRVPLPTQVFVDVGDQQSIADDLSTFQSHLTHVGAMLEHADDRSLCLLDEAGTGTDPAEGGALAEAVLRRLASRGARVVATTHVGALKAFAHDTPGVANGSMAFDRESIAPTYRFRAGVPGSSYAFEIADRVGLPGPVVADARARVGEASVRLDALVSDVERRAAEAEADLAAANARRAEAEQRLEAAERVRKDYEQRLERLRADTDARRAAALAEADEILAGANAAVERAVREIREAQADPEATREARETLDAARAIVAKRTGAVRKRQKTRRVTAAPPAPAVVGPIEPGDHVRVAGTGAPQGEGPVGEVMEITPKEAVVAFGQLVSRVKSERLVKVGGPVARKPVPRRVSAGAPSATSVRTRLDLRGARVDEALADVQQFVDDGVVAGVSSLEILHGKGTGALRQAIHEALARRPDVAAFAVAPIDQGGDGVTVVSFG